MQKLLGPWSIQLQKQFLDNITKPVRYHKIENWQLTASRKKTERKKEAQRHSDIFRSRIAEMIDRIYFTEFLEKRSTLDGTRLQKRIK